MNFNKAIEIYTAEPTREKLYEVADLLLKEGDEIRLEEDVFKVMSTPGHTPGSSVLIGNSLIFSGDTLFKNGYGRYDLIGGDGRELFLSLEKILALDENLTVYPGHGETTTIKGERLT